jgi:threonylcarbamoyladenosine tRNA methylthiotransferase MtaB
VATFSIQNFGCRATDADAAAIRADLAAAGLVPSQGQTSADVVVLNTCTVTTSADTQARDAVRKIHRANPAARIVVTGCYAQRAPEELAALEGVSFVVGNSHQSRIAELVTAAHLVTADQLSSDAMSLSRGPAKILTGDIFEQTAVQLAPFAERDLDRTRPILKIQDGCSNRCSYCVIPFVRGKSRSLAPDDVLREIRALVGAGAREVVLSGINLGSYGRDFSPRVELALLVRRILDETELEQLRFSSIEPQDVTEDFVALAASSPRIAPHFHVPLQSGADKILKAMHRWYRAAHYAERIKLVRTALPHAAIGADVIVGFPSEAAEDFRATRELIEALPFTYLHVFSFSARPGTAAELLGEKVNENTIHERARKLRALGRAKAAEFRAALAGRTVRALTLARSGDGYTEALTANYLKVRIAGEWPANQWFEVALPAEETSMASTTREVLAAL